MAISVFLCHKKILQTERDGHILEQENAKASILHAILETRPDQYDPWIDDSDIATGMAWETEIYQRLLVSDVLLVAIGPGTSKSEWVRREIALARALGIAVVPVGYDLTGEEFGVELSRLEIDDIQGRLTNNIKLSAKEAFFGELASDLEAARLRTAKNQEEVLSALTERRRPKISKALDRQRAYSWQVELGGSSVALHISSGDLMKTRDIDVIVNSENDYMQMARFFETRTVSSQLRRAGASTKGGRFADTMQRELDMLLDGRSRPVLVSEVLATSAGAPDSDLVKFNRSRYVFHVAAVQAVEAEAKVVPFKQPSQIESCVRACLDRLRELNESEGVVSPKGTAQREAQETRAAAGDGKSSSILFPLFGTGQGGSSVDEAVSPMLDGLVRFFEDTYNHQLADDLTDVYMAAFTEEHVSSVKEAIDRKFGTAPS